MKKLGFLVVLLIFYIYHPWFFINKTLSSGDFPYLFLENIKEFSFFPNPPFLWLVPYYQIGARVFVQYLGLSWHLAEKILWFWPFLGLSIFSSFYLTRSWIGVLIYTTSTYPLMLVGGGQMGVAVAYALAPLVLKQFINLVDRLALPSQNFKFKISNLKFPMGLGLVLGIQMMFDPRITYITMLGVFIYMSIIFFTSKKILLKNFLAFIIPIIFALFLNVFWIIPILTYGFPKGLEGYSSLLGFQFLSFADFSHSFSILHPNWPENIFGKIYFMRSEFVLLPILAYSSLLFLKNRTQNHAEQNAEPRRILFFAALGLVGAFLAKGANPPFGFVNEFLFQYFPGMSMFRDATKFYLLVVLSYSALIPFSLLAISEKVSSIKYQVSSKKIIIHNTYYIILTSFIVFWIFLIRPAVTGELGGAFKSHDVPQEYIGFKNFINKHPDSFKTLWVPQKQRFGFSSVLHPAEESKENLTSLKREKISERSIKYIVVPFDSEKEIFLDDRKYSEKRRNELIKSLDSLSWLQKIPEFGDLAVFEVK